MSVPAGARVITMQTQIQHTLTNGELKVSVRTANQGDEAAKSVSIQSESPGGTIISEAHASLGPGESHEVQFKHPLKDLKPGVYPLITTTRYADANGYPFSALNISLFQKGRPVAPGVAGVMLPGEVKKSGKLTLKLKNLENAPRTIRCRLVLPAELSVSPATSGLTLAPQEEKSLSLRIKNFSALPGSTYVVYALLEYDEQETHYTYVTPGRISVSQSGPLDLIRENLLAIVFAVLALAVLITVRVFWATRKSARQ